ncbi:hypothetical protein D3C81_1167230 [compost metagenome]
MITSEAFKLEEELRLNSWYSLSKNLTLKDISRVYPIENILEISEYQINKDKELIKNSLDNMSDIEVCRFNEAYKHTYPIDLEFIFNTLDDRMWKIGRKIYNRIFPTGTTIDAIYLEKDIIKREVNSFTEEIVFKGIVGPCMESCIIAEKFRDSYVVNITCSNPVLIESGIAKRYKTVLDLLTNKNSNYYSIIEKIDTDYELFRFMTNLGMDYMTIGNTQFNRIELFNSIKNKYI